MNVLKALLESKYNDILLNACYIEIINPCKIKIMGDKVRYKMKKCDNFELIPFRLKVNLNGQAIILKDILSLATYVEPKTLNTTGRPAMINPIKEHVFCNVTLSKELPENIVNTISKVQRISYNTYYK